MQNSTVDSSQNPVQSVPNPTGAVPPDTAQHRSPPPPPWGSSVDTRPTFGAEKLPNPGDQGTVSPMPAGIPGGSPRPAGETEGQGTRFTPGGQGQDLGDAGKDAG
jgi:hypothetical protein